MNWKGLLSEKRTREVLGGKPSSKSSDDLRAEFERDYDRAVFSTPVRRLQDKAQVFPLEALDGIRTSLEVSTVARDLASQTFSALAERGLIGRADVTHFTTIAATCALIHDVGNPPFGHAGEIAIQQWFTKQTESADRNSSERTILTPLLDAAGWKTRAYLDFPNFDGNAQTIRLITKLQVLADQYGLNLTCGTLAAAVKYLATSEQINKAKGAPHQMSKLGIFASEAELIQKVRDEVGLDGIAARHPVTFLVEAADDVVYAVVDLEDGIKKGVITWGQLTEELKQRLNSNPILAQVLEGIGKQLGCDQPKGHIDEDAFAQAFRIQSIGAVLPSVRRIFHSKLTSIEDGTYDTELVKDRDCEAATYVAACKEVGRAFVYSSKDVLRLELMGRRIIHDLMDVFWEGAAQAGPELRTRDYPGKSYQLISANYRHVYENEKNDSEHSKHYHKLQLVTDYVAGMTDTFALSLHTSCNWRSIPSGSPNNRSSLPELRVSTVAPPIESLFTAPCRASAGTFLRISRNDRGRLQR